MKRYKKLLIALGAVLALVLARATGIDQGLIDAVMDGAVEAIVDEPEAVPVPEIGEKAELPSSSANVPKDHFANPESCTDCHK